jgi:hypothetical protein
MSDGYGLEMFYVLKMLEGKEESGGRGSRIRCLALAPEVQHKRTYRRIGTALISAKEGPNEPKVLR